MKDPRLVEIEFLAGLERESFGTVQLKQWSTRLGVSAEFLKDMIFALFEERCLSGTAMLEAPDPNGANYRGFDPSNVATWGQMTTAQSVRTLLSGGAPLACVNHRGRVRLWRLRDELLQARRKDAFELLWDKRHWEADLAMRFALADAGTSTAILFIDVDDFKSVNEKAGHLVGDEILRLIFQTVLGVVDVAGDAYRWGGDEIAVILPNSDAVAGRALAEVIRADVERECGAHPRLTEVDVRTTVSVGVGVFTGRHSPQQVTTAVAALMKKVKATGKNGVVVEKFAF